MERYPLIGVSICAVVLLVLGSLTNVVGYQTVQSTAMNDSPLFKTQTQKATNQQQNIIISPYLGKGKGNILQFPTIDNKNESLKKVIKFISKMDDKTFARFTALCIQRTRQDNTLSDTNPNEITQMLQLLRTKPVTPFTWFPGLFLIYIFVIIYILISGWSLNQPCGEWTIDYCLQNIKLSYG